MGFQEAEDEAMARIVKLPNENLHKKSRKVRKLDGSVRRLVKALKDQLKADRALGVAAPQIGVQQRVVVVDLALDGSGRDIVSLINPEILSGEGEVESEEGCLSVPGMSFRVRRRQKVTVRGLDEAGRQVTIEADELLARVFQHEIDHLNGRLIADHGAPVGQVSPPDDEQVDS